MSVFATAGSHSLRRASGRQQPGLRYPPALRALHMGRGREWWWWWCSESLVVLNATSNCLACHARGGSFITCTTWCLICIFTLIRTKNVWYREDSATEALDPLDTRPPPPPPPPPPLCTRSFTDVYATRPGLWALRPDKDSWLSGSEQIAR